MQEEKQYIQDIIETMKAYMEKAYQDGVMHRDAHSKSLGVVKARFKTISNRKGIPKVGLFKESRIYDAVVRFSNGSHEILPDTKPDIRGIAIKVFDVLEGESSSNSIENGNCDFLLMSYPTIPFGTLKSFRDVITSTVESSILKKMKWIISYFPTFKQVLKIKKRHFDLTQLDYWSATPFRFGDKIVKYKLTPAVKLEKDYLDESLDENFLTKRLRNNLEKGELVFDFCVQFFENENNTPLEDASVEWDEKHFPFMKIGQLIIPRQELKCHEVLDSKLQFYTGNTLFDHRPVGGLNLARLKVYRALANFRKEKNMYPKFLTTREEIYNFLGKSL